MSALVGYYKPSTTVCYLCRAARHGLKLNGKLKRIEEQEVQQANTTGCSQDGLSRTGDSVIEKKTNSKKKEN